MIKVLIVDDSKVVQDFLYNLLNSDPAIQVVAVASSGNEAIEQVRFNKPDVITMDIHMPGIDGYEATRIIMKTDPTPIVIVSGSLTIKEEANIFRALEAGALAVVRRPPGFGHPDFAASSSELIQTVKLMSQVKITKLLPLTRLEQTEPFRLVQQSENYLNRIQIIAIGASTGGPIAFQKILSRLPVDLPVPVLIVQQIAAGFTRAFMEWLSITSGINLKIALDGETVLNGIGYIAPDHFHMGISRGRKIKLSNKPSENGIQPSIDHLFRSVAQNIGPNAFGVLLTGEGKDGAEALKVMKNKGAVTLVQNEESSVVFDMPREAIRIGAADLSLSLEGIADILSKAGVRNRL